MFCRFCGKVIPDDSVFCPICGTKLKDVALNDELEDKDTNNVALSEATDNLQTEAPTQVHHDVEECSGVNTSETNPSVVEDKDDDVENDGFSNEGTKGTEATEEQYIPIQEREKMPLLRRFIGSMIDKFLILALFIIVPITIDYYGAPSKLGKYMGLLKASPRNYEYIDKSSMSEHGTYKEGISQYYQDQERLANEAPHIGSTMELDKTMTFYFIILNLLYYILFESLLSASLGKRITGGVLLDRAEDKIGFGNVLQRALFGGILMFSLVYLIHFGMLLSNQAVIIVFFLLMDLPVFFTKRSLLDIVTGTQYAKR